MRAVKISLIMLGLLTCLAVGPLQALTLVSNGTSKAVIIVDEKAADTAKLAATEFQTYIQKISGAKIPIQNNLPENTSGTALVFIGDSAPARARGITSANLKPEGYRIVVSQKWMAVVGRDYSGPPIYGLRNPWQFNEVYNPELKLGAFGETGTLYGVYNFLEKTCGIRWYMHGKIGEVVPTKKTVAVSETDYTKSPDFSYRYPWFCDFNLAPEEALWYRRAGFGAAAPVQIIHSFDFLLTENPDLKNQHPEYFALVGGQRDFGNLSTIIGNGNLCLSNPDVVKTWVDYICKYFEDHPEHKVFPLSPNDGMVKICECADCQAQLSPQLGDTGKFSNYVWKFVDTVARGVGENYPENLVGCIAYEHYNAPPDNLDKLSPNTAVMICKSRGSYTDPKYRDKMNLAIKNWNKKTKNIYCWEYYLYSWPPWRSLPVAFPHIISKDFKSLRGISQGEFIEAESCQPSDEPGQTWGHINYPGMAHLNLYVTAKCQWNADTDVDKLLEEYYTLFYGPAKKDMQKFWTLTEAIWSKSAGKYPINLYTTARLQELTRCLDNAKKHTAKGSIYRQRVELIDAEFALGKAKMFGTQNRKPSVMVVPMVENTAKVDGNLRSQIWQSSACAGFMNKDGSPTDNSTLMFVVSDPQALAFTFIMNEPNTAKLQAKATKRDQISKPATWEDDSIELYLCPDIDNLAEYYQFTVNSKGAMLDLHQTGKDSLNKTVKWNSRAQVKSWKEKNRWIAQVRIPYADLGISPAAGTKLAANFYRNRYSGTPGTQSCWTPIPNKPKFTPELFGILTIGSK